ncbi:cytochrome d ubiquinol oxidase subunit II [Methylomagnum ishizawai]|uniref:Cytochrome d ubiquinol oxidase subunit II n=1 Tax=Methylomagnum ishizawai TaxID=1760988 RepID=A0A1Y6D792_9GAMM|nr:cytochrome d ubiquinol oxidase subunit II [Methylomagnum ishizawai]SMF96663.1 cytochrome d ubiquinol oxidase subunit II [Methylomagnum ishizawai]
MFDYETLRFIWWLFTGVVIIAFVLTSGFDFGICALLPFLGKTDPERRAIINTVGGTWEGNQVWLVLLGGALFAVWPTVYATLFSGLYVAMLLVLFALFFRPAGFDYRSKLENPVWRNAWDWGLFIGGAVPPILLGVLVGNLVQGLPFHFDPDLRPYYDGSFFALLNPFALLCGVASLLICLFHGAIYLKWRTEGVLYLRALAVVKVLGPVVLGVVGLITVWTALGMSLPEITQFAGTAGPSNPLNKTVVMNSGWMGQFFTHPWMLLAPMLGFGALFAAWRLALEHTSAAAFLFSGLGIAGILLSLGCGLFPFLLISTTHPSHSLTIWDASSSQFTLALAFWITVVFLPIVLAYTRWVYKVLWGSVTPETVLKDQHTLY